MATATLTSQLTDVSLDPGSPTNFGTGNAPASETVIHLQGTNCAATGHSGATGTATPVTADSQAANSNFRGCYASPTAFTRTGQHLHVWIRDLFPVRNKSIGGVSLYIANGTTAEALYYATGIDAGYAGGWLHYVVNLDPTDRPAADLGSLPTANIDRVGYAGNISATKGEAFLQNCYLDAIRRGGDGSGNTFTGGLTGDRLTFSNIAAADTASYGMFREIEGSLRVEGPVTFGAAALATWLQDSLKTINFANFTTGDGTTPSVAADYFRVVFADGTTSVTNITLTDIIWNGVSRSLPFRFNTDAMAAGDDFTSVRSTYLFGETMTFGARYSSTADKFIECQTVIPSGITLTDPAFSNCDALTLTATGDALSGGATTKHNTAINIGFATTDSLAKISNHEFENAGGTGHAIVINTAGTYTFTGNKFTGYGGTPGSNLVASSGDSSAAIFNNSGGLVTINVAGGGDTPSIRNAAASTTQVNNNVNGTLTGMKDNTEVRILDNATQVELAGIEIATVGTADDRDFTAAIAASTAVDIVVFNTAYTWPPNNRLDNFVWPTTDFSIPIQQIFDRVVLNPV